MNSARSGVGVRGMEERAKLVGGRLVLETAPGGGTSIVATVPKARSCIWKPHCGIT